MASSAKSSAAGLLGVATFAALVAAPSPVSADERDPATPLEVEVVGKPVAPPRSASETTRDRSVIEAAPHRTGGDLLQIVPGVFITQHSGQGKAYQVFYRGFDAVHGQDLEITVGGSPVNQVSNLHGQGYADLHFVMPEVVSEIHVLPGSYSPDQGDFAVSGTIRYDLGYSEPGVTLKGTLGSFGERRAFVAFHPSTKSSDSFAAFETQQTDGFGPDRAANRTSAIGQHVFHLGSVAVRVLGTGYATRFDSPGVVSLRDIEQGTIDRFGTYGINQGGFSSRYSLVTEFSERGPAAHWSLTTYGILTDLRLKQNYTGYLVNPVSGDTTQQTNEATTLGFTARYRRPLPLFSKGDAIEGGISLRHDWVSQSELALDRMDDRVLSTDVDAKIRALDAAGFLDLRVRPLPFLQVRTGLRLDTLAYNVEDDTPITSTRVGTPVSPGGQGRSAMGTRVGPKVTVDARLWEQLHAVASYGEGFRSPQARSLADGAKAPFTTVRSLEAGLRVSTGDLVGSLSGFRTALSDDLVFDPKTARNEAVPPTTRLGAALEYVYRPRSWFVSSGSATWTRATFSGSDSQYHEGDKLPYVPELIVRQDIAVRPTLGHVLSRPLTARLGASLTGMFGRPLPYGAYGHDVFLADTTAELRLKEVGLGLDVYNLLDAHWYDSEYTYSANWKRGGPADLVPGRYVTVGAPRTLLVTLSLYLD